MIKDLNQKIAVFNQNLQGFAKDNTMQEDEIKILRENKKRVEELIRQI